MGGIPLAGTVGCGVWLLVAGPRVVLEPVVLQRIWSIVVRLFAHVRNVLCCNASHSWPGAVQCGCNSTPNCCSK